MSKYQILYDDDEDGMYVQNITAEDLMATINDTKISKVIMSGLPCPSADHAFNLWERWPKNGVLILRDGAIYVPKKVTKEITKTVEEYVLED